MRFRSIACIRRFRALLSAFLYRDLYSAERDNFIQRDLGGRVRPVNRDTMTAPPSTVAHFLERAELSQYAEAFELEG